MSEETYALRRLKDFIVARAKGWQSRKNVEGMSEAMLDDHLLAVKVRTDEDREIIREINRMLKFKKPGRAKMKPKPAKRTSARVAKMAGKWLDMTDDQLLDELGIWNPDTDSVGYPKFCRNLRAICASAVSQTEPVAKKKVKA